MLKYIKDRVQGKASKGQRRSSRWRKVRRAFLRENPNCACCGGTRKLEVHHIVPFNVDPSLELAESNLITLCERKKYGINCHLLVGHLGNYRKFNPEVSSDAAEWQEKINSPT